MIASKKSAEKQSKKLDFCHRRLFKRLTTKSKMGLVECRIIVLFNFSRNNEKFITLPKKNL